MPQKARLAKHKDIIRLLSAGTYSLRSIASITGKSKLTVQRIQAVCQGAIPAY